MTSVLWLRRDLRRRDLPGARRRGRATARRRARGLRGRPAPLGGVPDRAPRLAGRELRAADEAFDGRLTLRLGDPRTRGPRARRRGRRRSVHVSAETTPYGRRRDDGSARRWASAGSSGSRPARRTPSGRAGSATAGRPVPGVHAVLPRLARARLARARAPRRAACACGDGRSDADASTRLDERARATCPATCRRRARTPRCDGGGPSATSASATTPTTATGPTAAARPGSRRTSSSARSTRARCSPTSPATRSQGAPTLRRRAGLARVLRRRALAPPPRPGTTCGPSCARMTLRRASPTRSRRGRRDAPATRSSTPACASCSPRAGCTTGCG